MTLNQQGDSIQLWHSPFPVSKQPIVLYLVWAVASWFPYRFLRRQIRWSVTPVFLRIFQFVTIHTLRIFQFVKIHTIKGFHAVSEAEVDVFLEFPCFLHVPTNVGILIFGSSAFFKPSLYIWKFLVHVLLKPCWRDFEHNLGSMQDEHNCVVVWSFFDIVLFWDWNENWPFQVLWPLLSFPVCWHTECSPFTASSFWILNSSAEIPSPLLALFGVMLPKAHLTSYSSMSGSRWVITPLWLSE